MMCSMFVSITAPSYQHIWWII